MEQNDGNNEKPSQQSKKTPVVNFQAGKFPIKIKVTLSKTPGEKGTFVHDPEIVNRISTVVSDRMYAQEEKLNANPDNYEDYADRVKRMICMLMARKLANSLTEGFDDAVASQLRKIASFYCNGPSALIQLIDHFGKIEEPGLQFRMLGQALLSFSYFGRAAFREDFPQGLDRFEALFINTRWIGYKRILYDFCIAQINSWAETSGEQDFNFGAEIVRMSVPKIVRNVAGYSQIIVNVGRTPHIQRMIDIAGLIEPFVTAQMPQDIQNALLARGVLFVNWDSNDMGALLENYSSVVDSPLSRSFGASTNWVPISVMKTTGSPAQLLQKSTEHMLHCYYDIGGQAMELGWMFSGRNNFVVPNPRTFHVVPPSTTHEGVMKFVDGMMKRQ